MTYTPMKVRDEHMKDLDLECACVCTRAYAAGLESNALQLHI